MPSALGLVVGPIRYRPSRGFFIIFSIIIIISIIIINVIVIAIITIIIIMIVIFSLLFGESTSSIMHIGLSGRGSIISNIACEHFWAA